MIRLRLTRTLTSGLVMAGAFAAAAFWARWQAEPILADVSYSQVVLDRNGELLRVTLAGDQKYRIRVSLAEVSPQFVESVLLLEDRYFYWHPGVNPFALARAAISTYGRGLHMGGSSLTMQVVRLKHGLFTKTVSGKLGQIWQALWLEATHSKREILEAYLNLAPYGANVEGVGAASRIYFNKDARQLTLAESLSLAVVPQRPAARNLSQGDTTREARARLGNVWRQSHPRDAAAVADDILPLLANRIAELPFRAPHFTQYVLQHHPDQAVLRTTLDGNLQKIWQAQVQNYLLRQKRFGVKNAAAALVNYETMQIEAYVGSADFFNDEIAGQVDGVQAKRSPGSTMKPLVYALALDQGLIHSHTVLKDTPSSFGAFDPENFDGRFVGPIDATMALIESRNVPAVYLASRLANPTLYQFLRQNEIILPKSSQYYGLSIVLGGAEMTLAEMLRLYAILARHGARADMKTLLGQRDFSTDSGLSPEAAYVTMQMLTENRPPNQNFPRSWLRQHTPVAWKTGTSHGFRDAWTIAVTGPYVLGVWLGNFDNDPNPALIGRELAAPLAFELMESLNRGENLQHPAFLDDYKLNVKKIPVCALSGHLPGEHCAVKEAAWFIPGKSPITVCDVHRQIFVSRVTGKRLCNDRAPGAVARVVEFWPSDFLLLFRQAGIAHKPPPDFAEPCLDALEGSSGVGQAPQIISPKNDVTYNVSLGTARDLNTISLRAVADADVKTLYWYAGHRYLGASAPDHALMWPAEEGDYILRVIDNLGRSDSRGLKVRVVR